MLLPYFAVIGNACRSSSNCLVQAPAGIFRIRHVPKRLGVVFAVGLCAIVVCVPMRAAGAQPEELVRARALVAEGDLHGAMRELDALLGEDPEHVEGVLFKGVVLTHQGRREQALALFRGLVRQRPSLPEPHNNLAVLYASMGRYEEAKDALLTAIGLRPDYETAYENLGDIYAKLALLSFERAREIDPGSKSAQRKATLITRAFQVEAGTVPRQPDPSSDPSSDVAGSPDTPSTDETDIGADTGSPSAAPVEAGCYEVSGLQSASDIESVAAWLGSRGGAISAQRPATSAEILNYKVYLDPFDSPGAAEARISQLRSQGIDDIIRIAKGEFENGIALGVYASEEAAKRRVESIVALGYPARYAARYRSRPDGGFVASVSDSRSVDPGAFQRDFPNFTLDRASCS